MKFDEKILLKLYKYSKTDIDCMYVKTFNYFSQNNIIFLLNKFYLFRPIENIKLFQIIKVRF